MKQKKLVASQDKQWNLKLIKLEWNWLIPFFSWQRHPFRLCFRPCQTFLPFKLDVVSSYLHKFFKEHLESIRVGVHTTHNKRKIKTAEIMWKPLLNKIINNIEKTFIRNICKFENNQKNFRESSQNGFLHFIKKL